MPAPFKLLDRADEYGTLRTASFKHEIVLHREFLLSERERVSDHAAMRASYRFKRRPDFLRAVLSYLQRILTTSGF
jgi:hypothetical protein